MPHSWTIDRLQCAIVAFQIVRTSNNLTSVIGRDTVLSTWPGRDFLLLWHKIARTILIPLSPVKHYTFRDSSSCTFNVWNWTINCHNFIILLSYAQDSARCFFMHVEVRWIVQESPIYHRVEGSLLYMNPLSVNSANFIFLLHCLIHFS